MSDEFFFVLVTILYGAVAWLALNVFRMNKKRKKKKVNNH